MDLQHVSWTGAHCDNAEGYMSFDTFPQQGQCFNLAEKTKLIAPHVQVASSSAKTFPHQLGRGFVTRPLSPIAINSADIDFSFSVGILGVLHICVVQPTISAEDVCCTRASQL